MAIDTASRRAAASTFGRLPVRVLPIPNGTIAAPERAYLIGCRSYVATDVVTRRLVLLGTSKYRISLRGASAQ